MVRDRVHKITSACSTVPAAKQPCAALLRSLAGPHGALRVGGRLAAVQPRKHGVGAGQGLLSEPLVLQGSRGGEALAWV